MMHRVMPCSLSYSVRSHAASFFAIPALLLLCGGTTSAQPLAVEEAVRVGFRRPVAVAVTRQRVVVANRESGTISTLDPQTGQLTGEYRIGRSPVDSQLARRGRRVFDDLGCSDCHRPPFYTTSDLYDVDMVDERGRGRFNPPSLRGVSQRDRLFHDGRAHGLADAINLHGDVDVQSLTPDDRAALLHFLDTL